MGFMFLTLLLIALSCEFVEGGEVGTWEDLFFWRTHIVSTVWEIVLEEVVVLKSVYFQGWALIRFDANSHA